MSVVVVVVVVVFVFVVVVVQQFKLVPQKIPLNASMDSYIHYIIKYVRTFTCIAIIDDTGTSMYEWKNN
jgi:hypothetical protein